MQSEETNAENWIVPFLSATADEGTAHWVEPFVDRLYVACGLRVRSDDSTPYVRPSTMTVLVLEPGRLMTTDDAE